MTSLTISAASVRLGGDPVLTEVSLDVADGERLAVVGASGSGKSTLLRAIAGFERVASGSIRLGDDVVSGRGRHLSPHRRRVGYVAQDGALFPHLTVRQNIAFGVRRLPRAQRDTSVSEAAALAGVESDLLARHPHEISGGQQQRVSLARALAPRPRLLLLDEPFSALDTELREQVRVQVVDTLARAGVTSVLVTHDREEALTFGRSVAVIEGGRVRQTGSCDDVFARPVSATVARLLGDIVLLAGTRTPDGAFRCVLGSIPVIGDLGSTGERVGMLRPAQVRLTTDAASAPARVLSLTVAGATATATVACADGTTLAVPVRVYDTALPEVGTTVRLAVDGGAILYDA